MSPCLLLLTGAAQGAILLWDAPGFVQGYSGVYSVNDDTNPVGIEIKCTLNWGNNSSPVPANNQVAANKTFGSGDSGLVEISPLDGDHFFIPPTYSINTNFFWIDYAAGVVNRPGQTTTSAFFRV